MKTWLCDRCFHEMEFTHEEEDCNKLYCPHCGLVFYIDDEDEIIWEDNSCDDSDDDGESMDAYDAALIWGSNGKDEDYTSGFTEEELEEALRND